MGVLCCINLKTTTDNKDVFINHSLTPRENNGNSYQISLIPAVPVIIENNQEEIRNGNLELDVYEIENSCRSIEYDDPFDSSFRKSEISNSKNVSTLYDNKNSRLKDLISQRSRSSLKGNNIRNIFQISEKEISMNILNEINEARLDPITYSKKIEKYSKLIFENKSINKSYLSICHENVEVKVYLKKDKSSFLECIELLKELPAKMKKENYKLESLIPVEELKFPCPYYDLDKIDDVEFIDQCIYDLRIKLKGKYYLKAFHYYISNIDIEPLSVLHVVDDSNFNKTIQRAIFNPQIKYIGINFCKIGEGMYIVYYVYAY